MGPGMGPFAPNAWNFSTRTFLTVLIQEGYIPLNWIELAHRGSHPGEIGNQQRLRYHLFFHDMNRKVKEFVSSCCDCQAYTDKKTVEPLAPHTVPDKNWSKVAVDLFGPMPSKNHIVVLQDLASRFPAAKLVRSTKASSVIPAIADIYNNFANPQSQLSDNGPPFNSRAMDDFCRSRNINMEKIPPLHPSANPAETFMKFVGKTMKIASHNKSGETGALTNLQTTVIPLTQRHQMTWCIETLRKPLFHGDLYHSKTSTRRESKTVIWNTPDKIKLTLGNIVNNLSLGWGIWF